MMKFENILIVCASVLMVSACDPNISGNFKDPDAGRADFSTFVAVGDSLTAGYADGALYRDGQLNSYPAILAQQFALVGGGNFKQALMPVGATGSLTLTPIGDLGQRDRLVLTGTGTADSLSPTPYMPGQFTSIDARVGNGGFENMGVPGAKFYHVAIPGYGALSATAIGGGTSNPYFARFSSSDTTSMFVDSLSQAPTFFVLWLGNNDMLSYATSGGVGADQTGNSDVKTYGSNDITDPGFFENGGSGAATGLPNYAAVVATVKGTGGAKGVLINILDVATIPFFTTVPYNAIPLDATQAGGLNGTLAVGYDKVLDGAVALMIITLEEADRRRLAYVEGQNPVLIVDETLTDLSALFPAPPDPGAALAVLAQARPATAEDFILLTASSKIGVEFGGNYGIAVPLEDGDVLTGVDASGFPLSEVSTIDAARTQYNATIKAVADADPDLLLFDAEAKLTELNDTGLSYGSGGITSEFATGGGFSLDGVHPTARGYAVISNEIFKVINEGFDAYIPPIDPSDYTTVFYQ